MKEIHKIYLVCLVILILFCIIYFSKEHFKNLFEQQTTKLLQVSPQENEKSCNNNEGLYVIECLHFRPSKIYLYIDDDKLDEELPFGFNDAGNMKPDETYFDEKKIEQQNIKDKDSNLRVENGIYINSNNQKNFDFKKLYYIKPESDPSINPKNHAHIENIRKNYCKDTKTNFCKGKKIFGNFKIIQFFDKEEPHDTEIKYFIKHADRFLYVEKENDTYVIKKLEMDEICNKEGDNYKYLLSEDNSNNYIDKDYLEDKKFNRSYNDIPKENICPKEYPYSCSDDIIWRKKCSENEPDEDGKCKGETIDTENTTRNFNCHGFKCYDHTKKGVNNWSSNDYCKEPIDNFAGKRIKQFLFNINAFKCECKTTTTDIKEYSFCKNHPQIERINSKKELPFYDKIEIVRKAEPYDMKDKKAVKINEFDLQLGFNTNNKDLYDMYAIDSGKKEGITEFKIVNPDEQCNNYNKNAFPSKWKEAENISKIMGCFARNDYFDFKKNPIENKDTFEKCKNNNKYYGFQSNETGGECFGSETLPFLPKYNSFNECIEKDGDEIINGKCDGNICGYSVDTINKIAVYKKENDQDTKNIMSNRVYNSFFYNIYNNNLKYNLSNNNSETPEDNNDFLGTTDNNTYNTTSNIQIIRVSKQNIEEFDPNPIEYGEKIKLRFLVNGKPKGIKINPLRGDERIYISKNEENNSYLSANTNIKEDNQQIVKFLRNKGNIRRGQKKWKIYNLDLENIKRDKSSFKNKFLLLKHEIIIDDSVDNKIRGESYSKFKYKDTDNKPYSYLKINDITETTKNTYGTDLTIYNILGSYKDKPTGEGNIKELLTYYPKFPKSHDIIDNYSNFSNKLYILNSLTIFDNEPNGSSDGKDWSEKDYRSVKDKYVRLFLTENLDKLYHWKINDDGTPFSFNSFTITNTLSNNDKIGILLPSKINFNYIDTDNTTTIQLLFEKEIGNYPFIIQNIEDLGDEELEFEIHTSFNSAGSGYIDIGKDNLKKPIFLYNRKYDIYLSINNNDEYGNSFLDNKNRNEKENEVIIQKCNMIMSMVKISETGDRRLKKICYKTSPYQSINVENLTKKKSCLNEITMNENSLTFNNNTYSFCASQNKSSQDLNNSFNPATYVNSEPYKPYPIPKNP